jgi:hypothetical protein
MKAFEAKEKGFKIQYPSNWSAETAGLPSEQVAVAFLSPKPSGDFHSNANIVIETLPDPSMTLDKYDEASLAAGKQMMQGFEMGEKKEATLGGGTATRMLYTYEMNGVKLKCLTVSGLKDGKAYIFTYTALTGDFNSNLGEAEKMIASFEFLK